MKLLSLFLSGFLFFSTSVFSAEIATVQVLDPWIRQAPPGMQVMGGFLKLKNTGDQPVIIVGGSSTRFAKVEIHRTEIEQGKARMIHQKQIKILPGNEELFAPGGLHLMMMKPLDVLNEGALVDIKLELENGESIDFTAPIKRGTMH